MRNFDHARPSTAAKRIFVVVFMVLVCVISAVSVMASVVRVTVIDGETSVSFEISGYNEEKILEKAQDYGIEPLEGLDTSVLDKAAETLTIYRQVDATVTDNGEVYEFPVSGLDVSKESILDAAQWAYEVAPCQPDDMVTYDSRNHTVTIVRAVHFTFVNCGTESAAKLYYGDTVEDLLQMNHISVGENDYLSHEPETLLQEDMRVVYGAMVQVSITADGETQSAVVPMDTVENVLKEQGIVLSQDDEVIPERTAQVSEGMEILVKRVEYKEVTEEVAIPYETVETESDSLYSGNTSVQTYGEDGVRKVTNRQKLVDGQVVETEEIASEVLQEPVTQVVLVGTKKVSSSVSTGSTAQVGNGTLVDHYGNTVSYSSVLNGTCTAYTGGGTTASGMPAAYGYVAVNPNIIPYGTRLYICSPDGSVVYGYAIAADTGGACMYGGYLADLYYDTIGECFGFGIRNMNVYILS
jgi:uncharacterized protein YabE (DUF348 family)/3D (Asp-Asp-Asp) domain-containing protein